MMKTRDWSAGCLFLVLAFWGVCPAAQTRVAGDAPYPGWEFSAPLWVLTTPDGADLPASAAEEGFPLLVRLSGEFFDFREAKAGGEDLRFSSGTGAPLAYYLAAWDAFEKTATLWVRLPRVVGNARQEIRLHWGNPDATSESSAAAVFNESNGYAAIQATNDLGDGGVPRSRVARSPDWMRLETENRKPLQTLAGTVQGLGAAFSVSPTRITLVDGASVNVAARAGGAQKVSWVLKGDRQEIVVAVDRLTYTLESARLAGNTLRTLQFRAVYPTGVRVKEIPIIFQAAVH